MRAADTETRAQPDGYASSPALGGAGSQRPPADVAVVRVARQPILDRDARLIGYELLFRAPHTEAAGVLDHREATAAVIVDGLLDVGLLDLVGEGRAYLNVSRDFLLSVRPLPLPAQQVVLELLEHDAVDDALLAVLGELVQHRFTIALDDFRLTPETEQLLQYARVVKIDVLDHTGQALEDLLARLREHHLALTLIAKKVETREEFEYCRDLGFHGFQGYFFAKPARVRQQRLPSQGLTALSAMADLSATEDFDELHRIITRDSPAASAPSRKDSPGSAPPRCAASRRWSRSPVPATSPTYCSPQRSCGPTCASCCPAPARAQPVTPTSPSACSPSPTRSPTRRCRT
ncbi:MAG: EAL domain-containing protein [Solirubrobacteraceae bacterium]